MGPYTEAEQQELVASVRSAAQQTLAQLMQVTKLSRFGEDEDSLSAKWIIAKDAKPHLHLQPAKTLHILDPIRKVAKRTENGSEDNLSFYFAQLIPHVIKASG